MFPGYSDRYVEPSTAQDERCTLIAEWYDEQAALIRRYQFSFYPKDNSIEMFDIKNRRKFLTRTPTDIKFEDLYIGSKVSVFSRQLTFVDFADDYTRKKLGGKNEKTLALIKPDVVSKLGIILNSIRENDLQVCQAQMVHLDRSNVTSLFGELKSETYFNDLAYYLTSGPLIALELRGMNAISQWLKLAGPADPNEAKETSPSSLRAMFGTNEIQNAFHGSKNKEAAEREIEFFFPANQKIKLKNTAKLEGATCCVIKPHAVKAGLVGDIITAIQDAGFTISALTMQTIEKANAEEFLEIYKGVVSEYKAMTEELSNGPSVAMEIIGKEDVPHSFREFCGPADPEIARYLRPKTLRAMFGKDKVKNAVHCTDLPEDAALEIEYFFRILFL